MSKIKVVMSALFPRVPTAIVVNGHKINRLPVGFTNEMKRFPECLKNPHMLAAQCFAKASACANSCHMASASAWFELEEKIKETIR